MKKLLIFMPSIEGGGVEKNFFLITKYLSKNIRDVNLITAEKGLSKKLPGINIIFPKLNFWRNKGRLRKYFACCLLMIKFLISNRSVLIFSFQANLYAILIGNFFFRTVISRSNSSPSGWSKNNLKKIIYKAILNLASTVIVNSFEFQREMNKKFKINTKCIYNPLNKSQIIKLSKKKIKNPFKKNTLKIINVGRLVDQKDQLTLLKSILKLKDRIKMQIIIIGRGENNNKLKKFINQNRLNKIVKIFYTPNPFAFIRRADIFILTSKFEGLPNVLLESISLKKFVISSDCPTGPKEILDNGKGGLLFKTGDENDLTKKIIYYNNNKNLCKKKIIHSYKRLERFNCENNLKKYLVLVKKYLS